MTEAASVTGIKEVPAERSVRESVRRVAGRHASALDAGRPPSHSDLETAAGRMLGELGLPRQFLGFAMVALSNAFWQPQYESVPFRRRLFFLPCCLRDADRCEGTLDASGLTCVGCSECVINELKTLADGLGYRVVIAEGTPGVVAEVMDYEADAVIGVACLDSLEKAFHRVTDLGLPHIALPLLRNGCVRTAVDVGEVVPLLRASRGSAPARSRSYVPLLREASRIFSPASMAGILPACSPGPDLLGRTDAAAREWLGAGGKRLRPFLTVAGYAVGRHGASVLASDAEVGALIPTPVRKLAVAIEVLHKASLVHDDIEDADDFRYGSETLHKRFGVPAAINVGDYLIGLGYRLVAEESGSLGAECVADVLAHLSAAHLDLCRGQGAELFWQREAGGQLRPVDALSMYAMKTAPAFAVALYAGLRAARARFDADALQQFTRYLGEAYQVLNDLDDWRRTKHNKVAGGGDAAAARPTILRAFALEAGQEAALAEAGTDPTRLRALYERLGVFEKTERLVEKLRDRASALAESAEDPALRDLLIFTVRTVL